METVPFGSGGFGRLREQGGDKGDKEARETRGQGDKGETVSANSSKFSVFQTPNPKPYTPLLTFHLTEARQQFRIEVDENVETIPREG